MEAVLGDCLIIKLKKSTCVKSSPHRHSVNISEGYSDKNLGPGNLVPKLNDGRQPGWTVYIWMNLSKGLAKNFSFIKLWRMGRWGVILDRQGYSLSSFSVSVPMMAILHLQIFFLINTKIIFQGSSFPSLPTLPLLKKSAPLFQLIQGVSNIISCGTLWDGGNDSPPTPTSLYKVPASPHTPAPGGGGIYSRLCMRSCDLLGRLSSVEGTHVICWHWPQTILYKWRCPLKLYPNSIWTCPYYPASCPLKFQPLSTQTIEITSMMRQVLWTHPVSSLLRISWSY